MRNRVSYWAGVFNGVADGASADVDDRDGKDVVGRFMVHPFRASVHERLEGLGAGFAASYGTQRGALASPGLLDVSIVGPAGLLSVPGGWHRGGHRSGGRNAVSHCQRTAYVYSGRFGLSSRSRYCRRRRCAATRLPARWRINSWQMMGTWVLTGEHASYNGVVPRYAFEPSTGKLGAFELTARYHQLTADRDAFPIFANPLAGGARRVRMDGGRELVSEPVGEAQCRLRADALRGGAAAGDRPTEHDVLARVQFGF